MPVDFVDKIASQLPVKQLYDDAVSPAAKQTGALLEDVAKAIRLALAPIQLLGAGQDRFEKFINKSVERLPEENRISPPAQIIGPVLEGIRYEPEDTPIDEMFSALLTTSMDREKYDKAHPAFPMIISQLSRDEAVILREIKDLGSPMIETWDVNPNRNDSAEMPHWINRKIEKELDFPFEKLFLPDRFHFYTDHLFHLGLACYHETRKQEVIWDSNKKQIGTRKFQIYHLMPLGRALAEAAIRENAKSTD